MCVHVCGCECGRVFLWIDINMVLLPTEFDSVLSVLKWVASQMKRLYLFNRNLHAKQMEMMS